MFKDFFSILPPYGQLLLTIGIVIVGVAAAWRGLIENKKQEHISDPRVIPMWLMMGPMHDALQSIHEIAECQRVQVAILRDIDKTLEQMDRGQQYTHYILEAILRDQELAPPPSRDPRYRRQQR